MLVLYRSKKSQPEGRQVTSIRADGRDADVFDDDDLEFKTVDEALEGTAGACL
jgi:hypothetical protein